MRIMIFSLSRLYFSSSGSTLEINSGIYRWASARATGPTPYDGFMIRWFIVIFLALMLISWFSPLLQRMGFGKLPGDLRFRLFGRERYIPVTTTILLSFLASIIAQLV